MKRILFCLLSISMLVSCGLLKKSPAGPQSYTLPLVLNEMPASDIYIDMDYGIRINVTDKRTQPSVLNKYEINAVNYLKPQIGTYPDVMSFMSVICQAWDGWAQSALTCRYMMRTKNWYIREPLSPAGLRSHPVRVMSPVRQRL